MTSKTKNITKKSKNLKIVATHKLLKLGKATIENQNYNDALAYYMELWDRDPENTEFIVILSFLLTNLAYRDKAILLLERALERLGPREDILQIMGDMANNMSMDEEAVKIYRLSIDLYPAGLMAYNNLASSLGKVEKFDEGIELMQQMLEIYPENHSFWNTLGGLVGARDGESAALIFYEEAGRLKPDDYRIANNLSRSYNHLDRIEESIKYGKKAIELNPDSFDAKYMMSENYFKIGDFKKAWPLYEMRRDVRKRDALLYTNKYPDWDGSDLKGKSILVMSEQGLGDELFFAAATHHLYEQAGQLYIGCDPRLVTLMQRSFPKAKVCLHVTAKQSGHIMRSYPDFELASVKGELDIDYRIPVGSIPKFFWNSIDELPRHESYLTPDPKRQTHWQKKLDKLDDNLKVGITWRSGKIDSVRKRYYSELEDWGPILKTKGVTFINMQYGDCKKELALAKEKFGVTIHDFKELDLKNEIDDSCNMFSCLDLALSPGNAPGVQASAIGTPVWWMKRGLMFFTFGEEQPRIFPRNRMIYAPVEHDTGEFIKRVGKYLKTFTKTKDPLMDIDNSIKQ